MPRFHAVRSAASFLWSLAAGATWSIWCLLLLGAWGGRPCRADEVMRAGVARVDITDREAGPVNDPLYVKALVLQRGSTRVAIITVDAVAIGEIGRIGNDYLIDVRASLEKRFQIPPSHLLINTSHCHGVILRDIRPHTMRAVEQAVSRMVPVRIGVGTGYEDRVQENRRMRLKDGTEVDVRHAYSMPRDEEVVSVGPIDPEIGILRIDRFDGRTLAVLFNFACHPIQGVPSGGNTADLTGFACRTIETSFGDGTMAFFLQGCAGDINPVFYKRVDMPRDAEALGTMLGLRVVRGARSIQPAADGPLRVLHRITTLPRADYDERIETLERERRRLVESLQGTTLNLKTFMELSVKYHLSPAYPSYYAYGYLHEAERKRGGLKRLDEVNRRAMARYVRNVETMERLTRINTNLRLLRRHRDDARAAGRKTLDVDLHAVRIGDFALLTFPGELTVEIGLGIKRRSPMKYTFVAGYTNGYIYYAPTARQLANQGGAQEDSDSLLAPSWQAIFEAQADAMLRRLAEE